MVARVPGWSARLVLPCLVLCGSLSTLAVSEGPPRGDTSATEHLPGLVEVVFADTASDSTALEAVREVNRVVSSDWYDRSPAPVIALTLPGAVPSDDTLLVTLHVQRPAPCYEPDGIESRQIGEDTLLLVPFHKKRRVIRCIDVETIAERVFRVPVRSARPFVVAVEREGRRYGLPVRIAGAQGRAREHRHVVEIRDGATGAAVEGTMFRVLSWAEDYVHGPPRVLATLTSDSSGTAQWVVPCTPGTRYELSCLRRAAFAPHCGGASHTLLLDLRP